MQAESTGQSWFGRLDARGCRFGLANRTGAIGRGATTAAIGGGSRETRPRFPSKVVWYVKACGRRSHLRPLDDCRGSPVVVRVLGSV